MKPDRIIRSKRKTIALIVTSDAQLIVRAPDKTPDEYIEWLIQKKKEWINNKLSLIKRQKEIHKPKRFVDGEGFLYLGKWYKLKIDHSIENISLDSENLIMPFHQLSNPRNSIIDWYKTDGLKVIDERVKWYCSLYGFKPVSVKVTDAAKRWGSCGPRNTLNFSWRLVMAPMEVIDYVVVHELCHTVVKNHSKDFWVKVVTILPDYKKRLSWLEDNQQLLNL